MSEDVIPREDGQEGGEAAEPQGAKVAKGAKAGGGEAKRRKAYNYTLQMADERKADPEGAKPNEAAPTFWTDVADGFVSPEKALEHVAKDKCVGRFRAVRVASAEYVAEMTTPAPVHVVRRMKPANAKARGK